MNNYFEARVKYTTIDEQTGKEKRVNLPYLVDAVSLTECEAILTTEMQQITNEFRITGAKESNYTDLFLYDDGDKYYECKVEFVSIDESAGKEKKVSNKMLVLASNLDEAKQRIDESLNDMPVDYEVTQVKETKIADVFIRESTVNECDLKPIVVME